MAVALDRGRRWKGMWGSACAPHFSCPCSGLWAYIEENVGVKGTFPQSVLPAAIIQVPGTLAFSAQQPKPVSNLLRYFSRLFFWKCHHWDHLQTQEGVRGRRFEGFGGSLAKQIGAEALKRLRMLKVCSMQWMLGKCYFLYVPLVSYLKKLTSFHIFSAERGRGEEGETTMRIQAFTGEHYFSVGGIQDGIFYCIFSSVT